MKVKRIAECSPWSILQSFWTALRDNWSSFLSGLLRQVLLYNQQSVYIYAYKCLCQCMGKVYLWVVWYAWAHHFRKWPIIFASWVTSAHQSWKKSEALYLANVNREGLDMTACIDMQADLSCFLSSLVSTVKVLARQHRCAGWSTLWLVVC